MSIVITEKYKLVTIIRETIKRCSGDLLSEASGNLSGGVKMLEEAERDLVEEYGKMSSSDPENEDLEDIGTVLSELRSVIEKMSELI